MMIANLLFSQIVPTAAPDDFTITVLDSMSLQLSWSPPPTEHRNGEILEYRIRIVEVETGREMQYNSTSTSMTASPLHPYYSYQCRVAAVTTAGIGPFTTVVEQRTDQDGTF